EVMTSPVRMPALSAGDPSTTCDTSAPRGLLSPSEWAMSGVTVYMLTPSWPRLTEPYLMSCSITLRALFTGMAKPMPVLPPLRDRRQPVRFDLEDRHVRGRIAADDVRLDVATVLQRDGDLVGVLHHVCVGDDIAALGVDDHAGAGALERPLARSGIRWHVEEAAE